MAALDPLASGLLSILAAGLAAGGTIYQGLQRQQAEREKEQRMSEKAALERELAQLCERIEAIEGEVKSTRGHVQEHALVLARQDETNKHTNEKLDSISSKLDVLTSALIERPRTPGGR